jgi:hypothetical protein
MVQIFFFATEKFDFSWKYPFVFFRRTGKYLLLEQRRYPSHERKQDNGEHVTLTNCLNKSFQFLYLFLKNSMLILAKLKEVFIGQ